MHELSLAEEMMEIIEQKARKEGFSKVRHIYLEIGQLSHVTPEAMRFCFEAVIKNTLAEGSKLSILETEGKALCLACGHSNSITELYSACEECGGFDLKVLSGDKVRIKNLEVV